MAWLINDCSDLLGAARQSSGGGEPATYRARATTRGPGRDRDLRDEGADILEISPVAFRKRLSRTRASLDAFLRAKCGLVNRGCVCRCAKLVEPCIELGAVDRKRLRFARAPSTRRAEQLRDDIDVFASAAELFRSQPEHSAPAEFAKSMRRMLTERLN